MKHSILYTSQQNSVDKMKNRSLKEMATFLLEERDITSHLWAIAVNCVSYIHNKVPHNSLVGFTPFESLMGHKPSVSHLRVFWLPKHGP